MTSQYQYPYDPDGVLPENYVTDTPHTINPVEGSGYALIVPKAAPFFKRDFELYHTQTGKKLKENVDYIFTHMVSDMSHLLNEHVYGSVTLTNYNIMNHVTPRYRTIGGEHVLQESDFAEYAIHLLEADGAYPWGKLKDVPEKFPVEEHELPIELTAGYDELIDCIDRISFGNDHVHDIHQIRYLDQILGNKLDANGGYKILSDKQLFIGQEFTGSVVVRLPKVKSECNVKAKLQIAENDGLYTLEVAGRVRPYNDGVAPERWRHVQVTPCYECWNGDVHMTYDSEHYPCLVLGNNKNWFGRSVSLIEYFTMNPEPIYGELNPFRIYLMSSLNGIDYFNTYVEGCVVEPPKSEGQITATINKRYYGVLPKGVYQGYTIAVYPDNRVLVGDQNGLNSAVIYDRGSAASMIMEKNAILNTVTQPGFYHIILRVLEEGITGDERLFSDLPERDGEVQIVPKGKAPEGSIILGMIDWPGDGSQLQAHHVSYTDRENAVLDGGQFLPIEAVNPPQEVQQASADFAEVDDADEVIDGGSF